MSRGLSLGHVSTRRDRGDVGARQLDEVLRPQLDLQSAPAGADEDRLPLERALVDRGRQPLPLAERADPADDVPGRALGERTVGELRALARGAQVELAVGRHDEHAQRCRTTDATSVLKSCAGSRPRARATATA